MEDILNTRKNLNKKILLSNQSGVSIITLVITIIVLIILAAVNLVPGDSATNSATRAKFLNDLSEVQNLTNIKKKHMIRLKYEDYGFKRIKVKNAPKDFVSLSSDETMGCVVDLVYIDAMQSKYGQGFSELDYENDYAVFGETDVYIWDKTGRVYYVKGFFDGEETIYTVRDEVVFEEPVIESVTYILHSSKQKAMISIEAYSNITSNIAVTVGGEKAGYQSENRYYIEKSQNGVYDIVVSDEFGNKATSSINITGILNKTEADENPGTVPNILSFTASEQYSKYVDLKGSAIDTDDGIVAYAFALGNGMPASGWKQVPNTKTKLDVTQQVEKSGIYYFWVKNSENISSSTSISVEIKNVTYTIKYELNGGKWSDDSSRNQEKVNDELISLVSEVPTKPGYIFMGWSTVNGSSRVDYNSGASYSAEANLSLYAVWHANIDTPYRVEHYKENENGEYILEETDELIGTTDANVVGEVKTYEYFVVNVSHPSSVRNGKIKGDGSLVLKIYYSRQTFKVTLSGANGSQYATGSFKHGTKVKITDSPYAGYEFLNWEIKSGDISDLNLNSNNTSFTMPKENVEIEAKHKLVIYSIKYELDGGTVSTENPKQYTIEDTFTLCNPTKDGYRFKGWSGTDISEVDLEVKISNMTGDRTYTANYNDLFTIENVDNTPIYGSVKVKIESLDNVRYEYSVDNGTTWISCGNLIENSGKYIGYAETDENCTMKVRALKADGTVEATKELEVTNILTETKVNAPKLGEGMSAVYWDGIVEKTASTYTTGMYNYTSAGENELKNSASKWANAKTPDGSYWVWIPRFAYKIEYYEDAERTILSKSKTDYEKIFIVFLKGTSDTECINKESGKTENIPSGYKVLDAFNHGGTALEGFWIAKYEMVNEKNTSNLGGGNILTTNAGNKDDVVVVSKPGLISWRGIEYDTAKKNGTSMYTKYNSELIKNKEWEAVAVLTQSTYGINTVQLENGTDYATGTGSSTTGNKSGVYDLSGNAWEYVQADEVTVDAGIIEYLDYTILNNEYASNVIGQKVRGTSESLNSNILNFPENGGADSRIGYRVALHIY